MRKLILVFICLVTFAGQNHAQGHSQENVTEALFVQHIPNPISVHSTPESTKESDMYKWQFRTEVKNNIDVPLQITQFEFYFYEHGEWVPRNVKRRTLTSADFTQWYSDGDNVADGWIQPGKVAVDSRNWVTYSYPVPPRSKWTYTAEDSAGNVYHAESEIELIPFVKEEVAWAETDRSQLVPISGRVVGIDEQPPAYAQLRLTNFRGNYQDPLQTAVVGKEGTFSLHAAKSGLYRVFIFSAGHDRFSISLMLDDNDQEIKMNIQPAPHDYDEQSTDRKLPQVVFGKQNSRLQKIWILDCLVQKEQESFKSAIEEYREAHEDMREFRFDWSETVSMLNKYMEDESDHAMRQYAAIQLGQLPTQPGDINSETILQILELLPPNSELWSTAPYLPSRLAYQYGKAMEEKFLKDFLESNPDRLVRAMVLAQLAMKAHFSTDKETATRYYEKLKSEYGDLEEIQHQLTRLNPDKHITAGKQVPVFELKLMDNKETVSNKSLLGKFYLIDFWAVWCAPCVQEMKNLHAVYEKFKDKNFSILSISFDQKPEDVVKFRKEKWRMPWLNAFVEDGFRSELAKKFEVFGIPKPILVGPNGLILDEGSSLRGEALERTLSRYLEGSN
ncbi:MAG: thioredoxin-like domain-containing protein [bacterium]